MALVADRSLDLYCSTFAKEQHSKPYRMKCCSKSVATAVGKIFESVLDEAVVEYSKKYDCTFFIVPCYPITRMNHASIITRFICKNSDFLSEIGVSSNQFQELFEKFITLKCKNEYATKIEDKTFILNGRGILLTDWCNAIKAHYGSSLVDESTSSPFDSNPGFIGTMESNMSIFTETGDDIKFKLTQIVENLAQN